MSIYGVLQAITEAKGSNAKIDVIKSLSGETLDDLKIVVGFALDPMLSYYMSEVGTFKPTLFDTLEQYTMNDAYSQLIYLNKRGGARREDKDKLARIAASVGKDASKVIDLIVGRDLKCGVGIKSFRKVFGNDFLPDFPVALTGSYDEKKIIKDIDFSVGAYSQLKSDGARCVITKRNGNIVARSRNGNEIKGLEHIIKDLISLGLDDEDNNDIDIDGELVAIFDGVIQPREIGNGLVNKAIRGTISVTEANTLFFVAWDMIHHDELNEPYFERLSNLTGFIEGARFIKITETKVVFSLAEAKQHYSELVARGEEGTILKNKSAIWTAGDAASKRNCNGYKLKEEHRAEFMIVGTEGGKANSKYDGLIGSLVCESSCGGIKFNVGSGLTDKDRNLDPESLIGTVVSVIYNGRIKPEGRGYYSLFLPRVSEFRNDKDTADSLSKVEGQEEATRQLKS